MSSYVGQVWNCRYFWLSLVQKDLQTRYRRSVLGIGWSLLQPMAMTAVLCVVFYKIFKMPALDYAAYLLVGLSFWNYFCATVIQGCQCIYQGEAYIRQHPAPIAIYPLRTVLASGFHFMLALCVVIVLGTAVSEHFNPLALFTLLPTLLLMLVLGWSMAVLFGLANVHVPDTQHLAEVGLQILFYATPIIYPPSVLADHRAAALFQYNPLAAFITLVRQPILEGVVPEPSVFAFALATTAVFATMACVALRRLERRIVFHL